MSLIRTTTRIAVGATLGLALVAGTAFAQDMMIDDDLAAKIEQDIHQMPPTSMTTDVSQISVEAEDGMLMIGGMADDDEAMSQVNEIIMDAGVDADKVSLVDVAGSQGTMIDDDLAAKLEQDIHLMPPTSETSDVSQITVDAKDGMLVVTGLVDGLESIQNVNQLIQDSGVDMDKVDNQLIPQ